MSEKDALQPKRPETISTPSIADHTIYHDSTQTPRARMLQVVFVAFVTIMVLITIILSIVQGIKNGKYGAIYFMLGVSLFGYVALEIVLIVFIRKDLLPQSKMWFLYFLGFVVILEAIFTDVLLYD